MTDKKTQIKTLYEDAAYYNMVHSGQKIHRENVRIFWNDGILE